MQYQHLPTKLAAFAAILLAAGLLSAFLPHRSAQAQSAITFLDFRDVSRFSLNGSAGELANDPTRNGALRLTNNLWQGASAFLTTPVSIANDASFSSYFRFRMSNPMGQTGEIQGADGIVFVVQTKSSTVGGVGGGIGFDGVKSSLGIEFDTWRNGVDPDDNHVGININGSRKSLVTRHVKPPFNNGEIWHVWVDYDGNAKRLELRWASSDQRPGQAMLSREINLVDVLGKTDVFVGFSSATGAAGNTHDILSWAFRGSFDPITNLAQGSIGLSAENPRSLNAPLQVVLILDASGSMRGRMPDGQRKIAVARQVLGNVIGKLPNDTQIALRVYGHRFHRKPKARSCTDTELVVPFGLIDRPGLRQAVNAMRPQGQTPIGLSLSNLAADFRGVAGKKLAVIVTDGIETCSPHPGSRHYPPDVVRSLQASGLDVKINIVGFDITASATRSFLQRLARQSNGSYFDARSADELSGNLLAAISAASTFQVVTGNGAVAATGNLNGTPVKVPVGTYSIRLSVGADNFQMSDVSVGRDEKVRFTIVGREGSRLIVK